MIRLGIEVLRDDNFRALDGLRVGLLTNHSAVDRHMQTTFDILARAENVNLTALFSPEHGFVGAVADGVKIGSMVEPHTGLPIHSLYGEHVRPTGDMLGDVDIVVCDIQDIGVRYYTYLWTITHMVEACGEYGVQVMILDRPNPLGDTVRGVGLQPEFSSLVGRYNIPIQHGMTLGEIVTMLNATENDNRTKITVIQCEGYHRRMTWAETRLAFVPPSPNMPTLLTAQHYPGACLIEGTNLSEGRGTPLPFQIVGASFIDAHNLSRVLNDDALSNKVIFRPHSFTPTASKFAGELCQGVQVHIIDADSYNPISTWIHIIKVIHDNYPDDFEFLPPHSEGGLRHFDRLIGTDEVREIIQRENSQEQLQRYLLAAQYFANEFERERQTFLIYDFAP